MVRSEPNELDEIDSQKRLLLEARQIGLGNILVALNADESLSDNAVRSNDWEQIRSAKSGTSLAFRRVNLIPKEAKILNSHVLQVPKCYPVYEVGYMEKVDVISGYLKSIKNLLVIGRYGSFKYNNQDHSILMGILAAEKLNNEGDVDLWEINTDTEYQEEHKIKDVLISLRVYFINY